MSPLRKLVGDTAVVSAVGVVNQSKGIVFIPLIVGALGLEGYGAFVAILLAVRLVSSAGTLELGMGLLRFASTPEATRPGEAARHFYSVLAPTAALAGLWSALLWFGSDALSRVFLEGRFGAGLQVASVVVFSNAVFAMARNQLRALRKFKLQSGLTLAYELVPYLAFVGMAIHARELLPALQAYVALDVAISAATLVVTARRYAPTRPSLALIRQYVAYTAPLSLSYAQGQLLARADILLVSGLLGLEAVAIYNVVYRVTDLVGFVSIPINVQVLSYLSGTWDAGREERARAVLRNALLVVLFIAVGMLGVIAIYFDALFALFLGDVTAPGPLWPLVVLIGLGVLANVARRFHYVLIRLHRTTRDELRFQLIGLVLNVCANLVLIPLFGLMGAALATFISYGGMLPFIAARYPLGIRAEFIGHGLSFACIALSLLTVRWLIPPDDATTLVASAGLAFTTYLALALLFKWRLLRSFIDEVGRWRIPRTATASP